MYLQLVRLLARGVGLNGSENGVSGREGRTVALTESCNTP